MGFTPHSISNQEFSRSVRGYDKDEVRAFLENISDEFEKLQYENEKMTAEIELLKNEVTEFRKIEKNLQETLLKAQESSTKSVDSAKKQTALMIKEAELKAVQIIDNANEDAAFTRNAVIKLREEKNLLIAKIKSMVDSQAKLLAMNVENIETSSDKPKVPKPEIKKNKDEINVDNILEKLL